MAKYKIRFKKSVAKDLRKIPNIDVKKILTKIDSLIINPKLSGCIKLSSQEKYRVRQGLYRIVYEIKDSELIILVIKIAHRKDIYK